MSPQSPTIKHIVMADDDDDDFKFFKSAAENISSSIKISRAANWLQLTNYLNRKPLPDIIFLDLNMPVKNGLECLESIRSEPKYDEISIIIYSTSDLKKDVDESYEHRANYYVVKPEKFEDIENILHKVSSMDKSLLTSRPSKTSFLLNTSASA